MIGAEKHPHHCGFTTPLRRYVFSSYFSLLFSSFFPIFFSSSSIHFFHFFFCPLSCPRSFSLFLLKILSTCTGKNSVEKNHCVVCVLVRVISSQLYEAASLYDYCIDKLFTKLIFFSCTRCLFCFFRCCHCMKSCFSSFVHTAAHKVLHTTLFFLLFKHKI